MCTVRPSGFRTSFFGPRAEIDAMVETMQKVLKNIESLRDLEHKSIRNQRLSRADRES